MDAARLVGRLAGKGAAALQDKAERDDWKGKASHAASRAGAAAKSGYEGLTGRDAKTDGLVIGVAGSVAAATATASAVAAAAAVAPLIAIGGLAAKGAGDKAMKATRERCGEEKVDSTLHRVKHGVAVTASAVATVGRELAAGYREGAGAYRNGPSVPMAVPVAEAIPEAGEGEGEGEGEIGVEVMEAIAPTVQGQTGWYTNPITHVAEFWTVTAQGWVMGQQ